MGGIINMQFFNTRDKLFAFARNYGSTFTQDFKTGTMLNEYGQNMYYIEKL